MTKKAKHQGGAAFAQLIGDAALIPTLLQIAGDPVRLHAARADAQQRMEKTHPKDKGKTCAITQSVLFQEAGIDVPDLYGAIEFGDYLEKQRHWTRIPTGQQQAGDVGSTCGTQHIENVDHVYLVLRADPNDSMLVADNEKSGAHTRTVAGSVPDNFSPTLFFLRAS